MQVTFDTIEAIHKLLTSTDWIDKHNPQRRLEKLQQELTVAKNDREKKKIQYAISGVEKAINSDFKLDLKSSRISEDNARVLLANINLLDNKEGYYNMEACNILNKLLEDNFKQLNTTELYEIVDKIKIPHSLKVTAPLNVNQEIYGEILPYCRIIANMYNGENDELNSIELANKLSGYFSNINDVKNYLKTVDYSSKTTIELSFQYILPNFGVLPAEILSFWHDLNGYVTQSGRDSLMLFSNAVELKDNKKFQELLNNEEIKKLLSPETRKEIFNSGSKVSVRQREVRSAIKKLLQNLSNINLEIGYKYDQEELSPILRPLAKELAENAAKVKFSKFAFKKSLDFIKKGQLKDEDNMPNIKFDFVVGDKKYNFRKLSPEDMRGFMLGKLSNSCQSVGDNAERCVLDGMNKSKAGFYIITDEKGKIHAQSYAWLAGEQQQASSLVLDSFENLGVEDKKLFIPAMRQLREELVKHNLELFVGTGGKTPEMGVPSQSCPKPAEKNLYLYGDSRLVYRVDEKLLESKTINVIEKKPINKVVENFQEFKRGQPHQIYNALNQDVERDEHIVKLINNLHQIENLWSIEDLYQLYTTNPKELINISVNRLPLTRLIESGLYLQDELKILYRSKPEEFYNLVKVASNLEQLILSGIYAQGELKKMHKTNPDEFYHLANSGDIMPRLVGLGIYSQSDLKEMHQANPDEFYTLANMVLHLSTLLQSGIYVQDELKEMYQVNPDKFYRLAKYSDSITTLAKSEIYSQGELKGMHKTNPDEFHHLANSKYNMTILVASGIYSRDELKGMHKTNPDEFYRLAGVALKLNEAVKSAIYSQGELKEIHQGNPNEFYRLAKFSSNMVMLVDSAIYSQDELKEMHKTNHDEFYRLAQFSGNMSRLVKSMIYSQAELKEMYKTNPGEFYLLTNRYDALWDQLVNLGIYLPGELKKMHKTNPDEFYRLATVGSSVNYVAESAIYSRIELKEMHQTNPDEFYRLSANIDYGFLRLVRANLYSQLELKEMHKEHSDEFYRLAKLGFTLRDLVSLSVYSRDELKKMRQANPDEFYRLAEAGSRVSDVVESAIYSQGELKEMHQKNPDEFYRLVNLSFCIINLVDSRIYSQNELKERHQKNPEEFHRLAKAGFTLSRLINLGIYSQGELKEMHQANPDKFCRLADVEEGFKNLMGVLTTQNIKQMYEKNLDKILTLTATVYRERLKELMVEGITANDIMYNTNDQLKSVLEGQTSIKVLKESTKKLLEAEQKFGNKVDLKVLSEISTSVKGLVAASNKPVSNPLPAADVKKSAIVTHKGA